MSASVRLLLPTSVDVLRNSLLEIVNACPVEHCNPADCPLFALRQLPQRQRLQWIYSLDQIDLEYLAAYHNVCMNVKLDPNWLSAVRQ